MRSLDYIFYGRLFTFSVSCKVYFVCCEHYCLCVSAFNTKSFSFGFLKSYDSFLILFFVKLFLSVGVIFSTRNFSAFVHDYLGESWFIKVSRLLDLLQIIFY